MEVTHDAVGTSTEVRFSVPRYGVLQRLAMKVAFTVSTASVDLGHHSVANIYTRFDLRARDKTIATLYPENVVERVKRGTEAQHAIGINANHLNASNGSLSAAAHTLTFDLPFSYTERVANALNTRFAEPLELVATTNSNNNNWADSATGTIGNITPTLQCFFLSPGQEELANMKNTMIKAGRAGIPRLQWSVYKENRTTATASPTTIDLKCPYPVFRTLVIMRTTAASDLPERLATTITDLKVSASGATILDMTVAELESHIAQQNNHYTEGWFAIDWNLTDDGLDQTGLLSLKNLANPQLIVTGPTSGVIDIYHYYYQSM